MITVRLVGGLGNQLFQYAVARALSLRLGTDTGLDLRSYRVAGSREFELGAYRIEASPVARWKLPPRPRRRLRRRLWQAAHPGHSIFVERQFAFDPAVLSLPDRTYLDGYFQSELYFRDAETTLRSEMILRDRPTEETEALLAAIRETAAVSLHIRRGDYLSDGQSGTLGTDYYAAAANLIASRMSGPPTFFVFSDEPEWARAHLRLPYPAEFIHREHPAPPAEELALMSACRHHIIANSSFSWWGAWLNASREKTVVAPKVWFAHSTLDTSNVVPEEWVRL